MTYNEYKQLVHQYKSSDSVKERKEIESKIYDAAVALMRRLEAVHCKYGSSFIDDSEYRDDRGGISLEDFGEQNVYLHYSDRWSYGGECDFGIAVPMRFLDECEYSKLENELKDKHIAHLKCEIESCTNQIKNLRQKAEKMEQELKGLEITIKGVSGLVNVCE